MDAINIETIKMALSSITLAIPLISALMGALVGGYITHRNSIKQITKSTRMNLQIDTCHEMLSKINDTTNILSELNAEFAFLKYALEGYISAYDNKEGISLLSYAEILEKNFTNHDINWMKLTNSFSQFWNYYESKEVILHKFILIYKFILNENKKLAEKHSEFKTYYMHNLLSKINQREQILKEDFDKIIILKNAYSEQVLDLIAYSYDFKIELQNYYLSHLFNDYTIPKREPENSDLIVLSIEES